MANYYYQQTNDIGKEIALVSATHPINDAHYREVSKDYYDNVIAFLKEIASANEETIEDTEED